MIDSPSSGMDMFPTEIATIGWTTGYAVMFRDSLAIVTGDTIGIEIILEPF